MKQIEYDRFMAGHQHVTMSAPVYFDAHNHLQDERFEGRREEIIAEARAAGVAKMVVNGSCEADWPAVRALWEAQPDLVIPSFGYHPWYLAERSAAWADRLREILDTTPGSVVGEIGLDRWKADLSYEGQEEVFLAQMKIAAHRNIAASIHCLKVWGRLLELLKSGPRPARGFLLHSYGGSVDLVRPLADLGAYFSFPGYYAHERKERQREAFLAVPLDRLLVETDAPDQLGPPSVAPHPLAGSDGKPLNHPANLPAIYRYLAELRDVDLPSLTSIVAANAKRLFGV